MAGEDVGVTGPGAAAPETAELPQRDRAVLWGGRPAGEPVTRELMTRIVRGLYEGWDVWPMGCLYVAAPQGADALTDPAVISAGSMGELIAKISETARSAR